MSATSTVPGCSVHGDAARQLALGLLEPAESRRQALAVERCDECRAWRCEALTDADVAAGVELALAELQLPSFQRTLRRAAVAAALVLALLGTVTWRLGGPLDHTAPTAGSSETHVEAKASRPAADEAIFEASMEDGALAGWSSMN